MAIMQPDRVTPAQAHYVVQRLLDERRVSPGEIAGYLAELPAFIQSLETRLTTLRDVATGRAVKNPPHVAPIKKGRGERQTDGISPGAR